MAIEEVLAYLQDVLDAINDMQTYFVDFPNRYDLFEKDMSKPTEINFFKLKQKIKI